MENQDTPEDATPRYPLPDAAAFLHSITPPQHPSTKAFKPLTNREVQLQTELEYVRLVILKCIQLLRNISDEIKDLREPNEESPF
jgi:hypothetical protein